MHLSSQRDNQTKRVCKLACKRASADCSAVARILRALCIAPSGYACTAQEYNFDTQFCETKNALLWQGIFLISSRTMNCHYGRELAYAMNCTMVHEFSTALNEWGGSICKTNAALFTFDEDYGIIKTKRVGKLACKRASADCSASVLRKQNEVRSTAS